MTPATRRAIVERVLRDRQPVVRPDIAESDTAPALTEAQLDRLWVEAGCPEEWQSPYVDLADRLDDHDIADLWEQAGRPDVLDVDAALDDAAKAWASYWEAYDRLDDHLRARAREAFLGTADVTVAMERLTAIADARPRLIPSLAATAAAVPTQPSRSAITRNAPPVLSIPSGAQA